MKEQGSVSEYDNTYTFSSKIKVLPLELRENLEELLHEANKLFSKVVLILNQRVNFHSSMKRKRAYADVRYTLRVARADRLLDPEDAREVRPAELVRGRLCLAVSPGEGLVQVMR